MAWESMTTNDDNHCQIEAWINKAHDPCFGSMILRSPFFKEITGKGENAREDGGKLKVTDDKEGHRRRKEKN